jgi:CheY-like chemotaxis protein
VGKLGRTLIALVEDDPLVRVPYAGALEHEGYAVVAAANGPEALAMLEDRSIDLVLMDVVLPGRLDGIGVAKEALRVNPRLKVIFTSGTRPAEDVSAMGPFLAKPFRIAELTDLIERTLGG